MSFRVRAAETDESANKAAVEWNVIEGVPCAIRLVKVPKPSAVFHDFDAYERLVEAARATGLTPL